MELTTEQPTTLAQVLEVAEALGLDIVRTSYGTYTYTRVKLGTIEIPAFDAPRWRDLGEGPSWQEQYTLEAPVTADILWEPHTSFPGYAVRVQFPVTSLLRQGGVKWGGVSLAAQDDDAPKPSTHTVGTYDYDAFRQLAGGTFFGYAATLAPGVGFREIPYTHDPSKTHVVLDLKVPGTCIEGYFWVCSDCMQAHVNGEEPIDRPASEPETWALWTDDADIALATASEDGDDAEESGEREFSWHACEGCGSKLAGSRFRFAWFNRP